MRGSGSAAMLGEATARAAATHIFNTAIPARIQAPTCPGFDL
jgi:hypothetical protein